METSSAVKAKAKAPSHDSQGESPARGDTRAKIVASAADLLAREGRDALTTRAVAAAAGVQAPAIYRLFGDKRGLLDAVAEHGFAAYLGEKKVRETGPDPIEDLRVGWDLHIGFGLANPAVYALMYGDPQPGAMSPAAAVAHRILKEHVRRVALAGRLRVGEARAVDLVHASGCGTVLTLLAMPEDRRDLGLSRSAREAVLKAIATDLSTLEKSGAAEAAVALRSTLPKTENVLTAGERRLLDEWLDRLADDSG